MEQDSSKPEFWNLRYSEEKMPWDLHGVPDRLNAFIAGAKRQRVLIPGCGSGYEVTAFLRAGWSVTAIDFSPVAVDRAKRVLGSFGDCVQLGDFFSYPFEVASFDVVYERTFLCALPPNLWHSYAGRMCQLIRPEGKLVGYFLYGDEPEPPPYPMKESEARDLFEPCFRRTLDESVSDSLPVFEGKERWQEWTRRL